tara:strand:- start:3544 stop:3909 length:366 start_codon:yes stop_codon:yes gene_type:complete
MKKLKISKRELTINSIWLVIILSLIGFMYYLDPEFIGLNSLWVSLKETFTWGGVLLIVGFSTFISFIAYLLMVKIQKEVHSLNIGDKISYNGCKGILKSINKNRSVIEIDVPIMTLSKDKK